jgi:uncharacterized peroxidase-related enzyme
VSRPAWIEVVGEEHADGALREAYDYVAGRRGKLSNIMRVHSLNPGVMRAHMDLYLAVMFGRSKLSRATRELVAVVVSAANECRYCVHHHAEALNHYWKDQALIERLLGDFRAVALPPKETTMLEYAVKLTKEPGAITHDDFETLRAAGLGDDEILDLNLIVDYFNFVNRIAIGLGVEDSEEEAQGYQY